MEGHITTVSRAGRSSLVAAMYAMAAALVLSTLMDTGVKMWPAHLGSRDWRFGAFGLLLSAPVTPLLGLALAMGAGFLSRSNRAVRALSIVALAAGAMLALTLVAFLIDYAALRPTVDTQLRLTFTVAATKAIILGLLVVPSALALGVGGLRAVREPGSGEGEPRRRRGSLVVGQS